jgi:beta-carotene 3-hydroxylase
MVALLITLFVFVAMEGVAWLTHRYIMHGVLWRWHKDHHHKDSGSLLEENDKFFVVFAFISMILFVLGFNVEHLHFTIWIALGILLYGIAYFLVHDVFIHQRLPFFKKTNNAYFRALRKAHKMHHKNLSKMNGECFGMLLVPLKYFVEAMRNR